LLESTVRSSHEFKNSCGPKLALITKALTQPVKKRRKTELYCEETLFEQGSKINMALW